MPLDLAALRSLAQSAPSNRLPVAATPDWSKLVSGLASLQTSAPQSNDQLKFATDKLVKSISAIQASDAPGGYKRAAGAKAPGAGDHENLLTKALNILTKPKTAVVAAAANLADPSRDFMKDLRHNVGTADVLKNATWFKDLPSFAKIGIGIGGDIAADPLTYLAPQELFTHLGRAEGVATELANRAADAFKEGKTAFEAGDAALHAQALAKGSEMENFAARIMEKGKGGIGGLSNAEVQRVGELIDQPLKGGLYFNVPGTGRIGQFLGLAEEPIQIPLGRNAVVRGASKYSSKALDTVRDSRMFSAIGDKWLGGEGPLNRLIRNPDVSPSDRMAALQYRNAMRMGESTAAHYYNIMSEHLKGILDDAEKANIDGTTMYRALGGKQAAIDEIKASSNPELYDRLIGFRDALHENSMAMGQRTLKDAGADPDLMGSIIPNVRRDHQPPLFNKDFATNVNTPEVGDITKRASNVAGEEFLGEKLAHPTQDVWTYTATTKNGNRHLVASVHRDELLANPQYAARVQAGENIRDIAQEELKGRLAFLEGTPMPKLMTRDEMLKDERLAELLRLGVPERQVAEMEATRLRELAGRANDTSLHIPEDRYNLFIDGRYQQIPAADVEFDHVPPDEFGRTVREQVNDLAKEHFGNDVYVEDYGTAMERALRSYASRHGREVAGAMLRHRGIGEALDIPGSVAVANTKIKNAAEAVDLALKQRIKAGDTAALRAKQEFETQAAGAAHLQDVMEEVRADLERAAAGSPEARALEQELGDLQQQHSALIDHIAQIAERIAPDEETAALMRRQIQGERGAGKMAMLGTPETPIESMSTAELSQHIDQLQSMLNDAYGELHGNEAVRGLLAELEHAKAYEQALSDIGPIDSRTIGGWRASVRAEAKAQALEIEKEFEAADKSLLGVPPRKVNGVYVYPSGRPAQGEWDWFTQLSRDEQQAIRNWLGTSSASTGDPTEFAAAWAAQHGLPEGVDAIGDFLDRFREYRLLKELGASNSTKLDQLRSAKSMGLNELPSRVGSDFMFMTGVNPSTLFDGEHSIEEIAQQAQLEALKRQGFTEAPTNAAKDIEAEINQIATDQKNLGNRLGEATAEMDRRSALHQQIDEFTVDVGRDLAPEIDLAHRAIDRYASDAVVEKRIIGAVQGLADEMPKLPTPPPFALTTMENMGSRVESALSRVAAMREKLAPVADRVEALGAEKQALLEQANQLEANINDIQARIVQLDKEFAATDAEGNMARSRVNWAASDAEKANQKKREILLAALDGEMRAAENLGNAIDDQRYVNWLMGPKGQDAVRSMVRDNWVAIGRHTQVPEAHLGEAMALLTKLDSKESSSLVIKYFDKLTKLFKAWSIAQPGFIIRHGYSGMFMNYLMGVSPGSYRAFLKADRAFLAAVRDGASIEEALQAVPDNLRDAYSLVHSSGVLEQGTQTMEYVGNLRRTVNGAPTNILDRASDTVVNRAMNTVNHDISRISRGAAAMDAATKTGSIDRVYDAVFKAHFNYNDINNFERQIMTRCAPFYIYFRKSIPAMLEGLFTNPKAFARVAEWKQVIESVSPPEDLVPSWMQDRLNIRMPFSLGNGQSYLMPDLPVRSLQILTNPREAAGQLNPLIKTPIEMRLNSKIYFGDSSPFQGLVQVPPWMKYSGIALALQQAGVVKKSTDGKQLVDDKVLYAVEQMFPFLGKARRLLPTEKRYQDRLATTFVDFLFGVNMKTNTTTDIKGELTSRQKDLDAMAAELGKLGYGGYQNWTKQVAVTRKPTANDKRPYLTLISPKGGLGTDSPYTNVSIGAKKGSATQALADLGASGQLQAIAAAAAAKRTGA